MKQSQQSLGVGDGLVPSSFQQEAEDIEQLCANDSREMTMKLRGARASSFTLPR